MRDENMETTIDLLCRLRDLTWVKMPMKEIIAICSVLKAALSGFAKPDDLEPCKGKQDVALTIEFLGGVTDKAHIEAGWRTLIHMEKSRMDVEEWRQLHEMQGKENTMEKSNILSEEEWQKAVKNGLWEGLKKRIDEEGIEALIRESELMDRISPILMPAKIKKSN